MIDVNAGTRAHRAFDELHGHAGADFHRLFDAGLVSVTPDMTIRVSPRIREAWFNGKAYYRMDGQPLTVT